MTRERAASRDRRAIYHHLRAGTGEPRKVPTTLQIDMLFQAIERRNFSALGVRLLATLELNDLHPLPNAHCEEERSDRFCFERKITFIAYAAWRRRHGAVKNLLVAGARATVSARSPFGLQCPTKEDQLQNLLSNRHGGRSGLTAASAVHVVESVGRMRVSAARDATLGARALSCKLCGDHARAILFDPCGCPCCEKCVWTSFLEMHATSINEAGIVGNSSLLRGELSCPVCRTPCPSRGYGQASDSLSTCPLQSGQRSVAPSLSLNVNSQGGWRCECCLSWNRLNRDHCGNCAARPPAAAGPPSLLGENHSNRDTCNANPVVFVEVAVTRLRVLSGGSLVLMRGRYVGGTWETTGHALPMDLDIVCNFGEALTNASDLARDPLVRLCTFSNDRLRVHGIVHRRVHDKSVNPEMSTCLWEIHADMITLLMPRVFDGVTHSSEDHRVTSSAQRSKRKLLALPPREAALASLTTSNHAQRCDRAASAAADGDLCSIEVLSSLGFDWDQALDEYGQRALHIATAQGQSAAVHLLLQYRANPCSIANGGATPASVAAACGHGDVLLQLIDADADLSMKGSQELTPLECLLHRVNASTNRSLEALFTMYACKSSPLDWLSSSQLHRAVLPGGGLSRFTGLIGSDVVHPGAGAFYIDDAIAESQLAKLDALFAKLPTHPRGRCSQALSDRSYYCDSEGWVRALIKQAFSLAKAWTQGNEEQMALPCSGHALAHMRFLVYNEAGGGLPPHTDLSRTRRDGQSSKATFLLYLTDCKVGGETVLLESLSSPTMHSLAAIRPRRGRLLIFPHSCPHLAREVVAHSLPKLLLRGEVL